MGSTESGVGVKNGGAGSIVWVRRRNGSWWPGKILGHDELSASHLMSPRSGTPVKLLGREDASVDWYNLEKSKRVKAFRCGEFDDCIERAEASYGLPAKKREKYARREDAIIHALELEKQFQEKGIGKVGRANAVQEHSSESERKELVRSSGVLENGNGKLSNHELRQVERTVDISKLIERKDVSQHIHKVKDDTHPGLKEHGAYLSGQMRDIPSFGLKAVPINRKFPPLAGSEDSGRLFVDGLAHGVSTAGPCFENSSDSDSKSSLGKRKHPLESSVEDSFPKRRDRFHSPVKVWQNNVELHDSSLPPNAHRKGLPVDGVHHSMYLPSELHETFVGKQGIQMELPISRLQVGPSHSQFGGSAAETTSGSSEETESDSSETHSLEAHVEAGALHSDAETRAKQIMLDRLPVHVGHESTSSEEYSELPLDRSEFYFHDQSSAAGVSKWQLKGKRNVRNINKRPIDRSTGGTHIETRGISIGHGGRSNSFTYYHGNGYTNDTDFIEDNFNSHSQGFSKRGYLPSLSQARQNFIGHNMIDSEELTWGRPLRGFWGERGVFNTIYGSPQNGHGLLIDVDLKVQANRQGGEHVPWVSLMSRLNGKAIIGHPVQVETLEDGSASDVLLTSDACGDVRYDINRSQAPPAWRTAKRTANFRVPRPQASSSQLEGSEEDDNEYIQQSGKVRSKKNRTSNLGRKSLLMNKAHSPHIGAKKSSRRTTFSSSQKTKTLSSIGFNHKFPTKRKDEEISHGVVKSLNSRPQAVACIPVKLVYSRLLEAVGRPPSAPARHGVSVNSNKEEIPLR